MALPAETGGSGAATPNATPMPLARATTGARKARCCQQADEEDEHGGGEGRRVAHEAKGDEAERETEAELQAGQHRLRHDPADAVDPAGEAEDEENEADHDTARGERGRRDFRHQEDRHHRLHRLNRDWQAVAEGRGDVEEPEADQERGGRETCHGDRAEDQRQERPEVAAGAADLPEVEAEVGRGGGHGALRPLSHTGTAGLRRRSGASGV
jgi:hypothetical protein